MAPIDTRGSAPTSMAAGASSGIAFSTISMPAESRTVVFAPLAPSALPSEQASSPTVKQANRGRMMVPAGPASGRIGTLVLRVGSSRVCACGAPGGTGTGNLGDLRVGVTRDGGGHRPGRCMFSPPIRRGTLSSGRGAVR